MTKREKILLGILGGLALVAWGPMDKGEEYTQVGGGVYADYQVLAVADTEEAFPDDFGGGDLCIPYGALTVVQFNGGTGHCAFHQAVKSDMSFTNTSVAEDACDMTDTEGDDGSVGACTLQIDKVPVEQTPTYMQLKGQIGARVGICDTPKEAWRGGPLVYPPCRIDADCTSDFSISGATCDTTPDRRLQARQSCAVLTCGADTANTGAHIRVEL